MCDSVGSRLKGDRTSVRSWSFLESMCVCVVGNREVVMGGNVIDSLRYRVAVRGVST